MADLWPSKIHSCGTLTKRRLSEFSYTIHCVTITVGLRFGPRLPTFPFTIAYRNITVGHFRLQLHVASLQLDYVSASCILAYNRVATQLFSVEQGLVTVPFWEYWTSPYSSHYRPYT